MMHDFTVLFVAMMSILIWIVAILACKRCEQKNKENIRIAQDEALKSWARAFDAHDAMKNEKITEQKEYIEYLEKMVAAQRKIIDEQRAIMKCALISKGGRIR